MSQRRKKEPRSGGVAVADSPVARGKKATATLVAPVGVPEPDTLALFYTQMMAAVLSDEIELGKAGALLRCADGIMRVHRFNLAAGTLPGSSPKRDPRAEKIAKLEAELRELKAA